MPPIETPLIHHEFPLVVIATESSFAENSTFFVDNLIISSHFPIRSSLLKLELELQEYIRKTLRIKIIDFFIISGFCLYSR
jgi:hypothetical protein